MDGDYLFLSNACLVCRRWAEESRVLIWRNITITSEEGAQRVLASPVFGFLQPQTLELLGPGLHKGVTVATTAKLLSGLKGLANLRLECFLKKHKLGLDVLCSPNLHA